MGCPKIRGTILGSPYIRMRRYWGLYWGRPILGNCHIGDCIGEYQRDYQGIAHIELLSILGL